MHIVLIIENFNPHAGGNEQSTSEIASELVVRGHQVTVLAGYCPSHILLPDITVHAYSSRRSASAARLMLFTRWACRQLARMEHDVSISMTMAVPAMIVQPRGGTIRETLIRNVAMRNTFIHRQCKRMLVSMSTKQRLLLMLESRTLKNPCVKKIIAVSEYVRGQLMRHYGVPEDHIALVPNGASIRAGDSTQQASWRTRIRQGFHVSEQAIVYLFAAQKPKLKGFFQLMQAMREIIGQSHQSVVMLAGSYGFRDYQYVSQLGLRNHVRFVGHTRRMPVLYAAADVTVLPTWYDPCSRVVLESLMMNCPTISTKYNGASEWLVDDNGNELCGRVIDSPSDVPGLVRAMVELADTEIRGRCRLAADDLKDRLTMGRHVDNLLEVIKATSIE